MNDDDKGPALTEKVRKVFDKAFEGLEGVSYTSVALLASRTTGCSIKDGTKTAAGCTRMLFSTVMRRCV